ncbi:MAG: glutamate--tRNA ligase family protein [Patescibacteria group bacterium]
MTNIVVRFPPSPTGHAHIGSYRTAIFNYLFAKKHNAKFLLRIEDTDKARSKMEYQEGIIESLSWLGLGYDGFSIQSENIESHKKAIQKLIVEDKAYVSKEEAKDGSGVIKEIVRFRNPNKVVTFKDLILGDISVDTTDLGDFVIARNTEDPLYHLAVVVDDTESEVTHVIRGMDHISNTPRQILLIEALGAKVPEYAHIPLVLGEDKQKLSKRKGALSVLEYKKRGYLPSAILNAATFIGFNPGGEKEIYTLQELIEVFDLSKVQKGGAVFNPVKLDWFNQEHMKLLSEDTYIEFVTSFIPAVVAEKVDAQTLRKILLIVRDRLVFAGELEHMDTDSSYTYMFESPYDSHRSDEEIQSLVLVPEKMKKGAVVTAATTHAILEDVKNIIASLTESDFNSVESIKEKLWAYAEEKGKGIVLWPLRMSLTLQEKSLDPFSMIYILGKDESISRIQKAQSIMLQ